MFLLRLTGLVLFVIGPAMPALAGLFRAAAVKVDITPENSQWLMGYGPRQSTGVHDRIHHRIVAMNDGKTDFVVISSDLGGFPVPFYDEYCRESKGVTGLSEKQVWWTITHTHAAPEIGPPGMGAEFLDRWRIERDWDREYAARVKKSLTDGIVSALARLEPARMATGWGRSMANINRRARDAGGKIFLGLNPDAPVDRSIGLIRLERPDGSVIALMANYAMHGTVLGGVQEISGDFAGIVAEYVEEKLGAPMLYINGAAGDVGPIHYFNPHFRNLPMFNVLLGDRILAANRSIRVDASEEPAFVLEEQMVETTRKQGFKWPPTMDPYQRVNSDGIALVRIPVRYARLRSDTVIWAAPIELFCEIGMRVRNESPVANTFFFGYTNGWMGYLCTKKALSEGGYETTVTPFTELAEQEFGDAVIQRLYGIPR